MKGNDTNTIFFQKDSIEKWIEHRYKPCDLLQGLIKEYLILECAENTILETLPSNSFSLNYILKGDVYLSQDDGTKINLPKAVSFGITQRFFHFTFSDYATLFVVIFNPGFASTIINKPLNEFFENFISMDDFFDKETNLSMIKELNKEDTHEDKVRRIEHFLINKMLRENQDSLIYNTISKIHQQKGLISVAEIVNDMPISRDTFEKKFKKLVGTTPKKYANIIRIRNLFENRFEKQNLTDIALTAGYYDQSHFIKDFKFYTGKLPSDCF